MRKLRRLGVGGGAALLAAALIVPAGGALAADSKTVTDQYGAAASGEVLDIHLLGRHLSVGQAEVQSTLDAVTKSLTAEAKGVATMLVPAAQAVARFNDPAAPGGKACAVPQVQNLLGILGGAGNTALPVGGLSIGGLLPKLELNIGCGEANVGGAADSFMAESVGGLVQIKLALPEALTSLIGTLRGTVNGLLGQTPAGNLTNMPITQMLPLDAAQPVLNTVTGLLGNVPMVGGLLGGAGGASGLLGLDALAPVLNPTQTVDNLLAGIEQGDLLRVNLGVASARNAGDLTSYLSQAVSEGGSIELLPNFGGVDKALLKISIAKSTAKVAIDRAGVKPDATAESTIIRIESPLLPDLSTITGLLSGVPIVNGLVGSAGLPATDMIAGLTDGLLGGVPVVGNLLGFDTTVKQLGLNSGPGYIEVRPGMSVSLFCNDGLLSVLCSEISVGAVKPAEVLPNGRTRIESSVATIHLLKGLGNLGLDKLGLPVADGLLGGLNLGTILGSDLLGGVLNPLLGAAGLSIGEPSDVPGIKLSLAHAMAEAGGVKVMGAFEEKARELAPVAAAPVEVPALPRTGGLPVDATAIPVLLGAAAGLRMLARRRRSA